MSKYVDDPRVEVHPGPSYTVTRDGKKYHVLNSGVFAWTICQGFNLDFVIMPSARHDDTTVTSDQFAIGFPDADAAIAVLIGDPA